MERTKKLDVAILAGASALVLLWGLGSGSLSSWDEALYAQVSREILTTGNWIDLSWAGQAWSDKPPLCMWATAFFYILFGVSEFSARLFSALCGVGTVLVTYLFADKLYNRKAALTAALLLLSTWHFIWVSKNGILDGALTFFIILSLYLFVAGETNKRCLFFSSLAFAAAFLTKGVAALLIPISIIAYVTVTRKFRIFKERSFILGAATALLILIAWHGVVFMHYGREFIANYFTKHLLTRTTHAVEGHTGGIFTYFKVIPNKGRPWGALGLIAVCVAVYRVCVKKEVTHLMPLFLFASVLLVFSITKTKLHWYILPLYPALAMLAGAMCEKLFQRKTVAVMTVLCLAALAYQIVSRRIFDLDHTPETKSLAHFMKASSLGGEPVYLYDISDPAMQFYCAGFSKNVDSSVPLTSVLAQPVTRAYILVNRGVDILALRGVRVATQNKDYIFIDVQADK